MVGIVVCSRHTDYEALTIRLRARSAVLLQPLGPSHIDAYLAGTDPVLIALRTLIQQDATIAELATSPLILSTMMLAAQGGGGAWLHSGVSITERRRLLFDAYISAMLVRRAGSPIGPPQMKRYLIRLARAMQRHTQTVCLLDQLQPSWLPSRRAQFAYTLLVYDNDSRQTGPFVITLLRAPHAPAVESAVPSNSSTTSTENSLPEKLPSLASREARSDGDTLARSGCHSSNLEFSGKPYAYGSVRCPRLT
jgi:hypothetical protein